MSLFFIKVEKQEEFTIIKIDTMIKLFKSKESKIIEMNKIVEEIHQAFYSEVDKLLADAKITLQSNTTVEEEVFEKARRLRRLGFGATAEVILAEKESSKLAEIDKINNEKKKMAEIIEYFSFKYPLHKFITEDSVKKICEKYNLVYGDIGRYIGTVPDKNLAEIENNPIKEEDMLYLDSSARGNTWGYYDYEHYKDYLRNHQYLRYDMSKAKLEIAAPLKDFNLKDYEVRDFKLSKMEIPDPVVLQPVFRNKQKGYLILSAWGIESTDELVVNQKMN